MAIQIPNVSDLLSQKVQEIQSRLPLRMAGTGTTETVSFADELSSASAAVDNASITGASATNTATADTTAIFASVAGATAAGATAAGTSFAAVTGAASTDDDSFLSVLAAQALAAASAPSASGTPVSGTASGLAGSAAQGTGARTTTLWPRLDALQLETVMPRIDAAIDAASVEADVDPLLLRALIRQESSFQPFSLSSAGAMGLTQLMPGTAADLGVTHPYDIEQNVSGGARYLRQQLDAFNGDLSLALAAYNAGPNAVRTYGGVPPYEETISFVDKVTGSYRLYQSAIPAGR